MYIPTHLFISLLMSISSFGPWPRQAGSLPWKKLASHLGSQTQHYFMHLVAQFIAFWATGLEWARVDGIPFSYLRQVSGKIFFSCIPSCCDGEDADLCHNDFFFSCPAKFRRESFSDSHGFLATKTLGGSGS